MSRSPRVALMSIRPVYADLIFGGKKRIELRRQRPRLDSGDVVVVYTTSPVKVIRGAFIVDEVMSLPVGQMWKRFRQSLGVMQDTFFDYFDDRELAHGIRIAGACTWAPEDLEELRGRFSGFRPPQSYMFWPPQWDLPTAWRTALE